MHQEHDLVTGVVIANRIINPSLQSFEL